MQTIASRGLTAGSLFKILFIGLLIPMFILSAGCGIASYFGYGTVTFNGQQMVGIKGLLYSFIIGVMLPLLMSMILWFFIAVGVWVWTRASTITLSIKQ